MCDTNEEREKSKQIFLKAKSMVEFMKIWSKFYENKICIPTYLSGFVEGEDNPHTFVNSDLLRSNLIVKDQNLQKHDNVQTTYELGQKFKEITRRGFLAIDSQVTIPGNQKGYVIGFLPNKMAKLVTTELNRYSGIVSFYSEINEKFLMCENLYVTYDALDEDIVKSAQQKKMLGDPFTQVGRSDVSSFEMIREWMNPKLQKKFIHQNYKYIVIVSSCFDADPHLVFDKLLEVLRNI